MRNSSNLYILGKHIKWNRSRDRANSFSCATRTESAFVKLSIILFLRVVLSLMSFCLVALSSWVLSRHLLTAICHFTNHVTIMCGAESRTVMVAIIVKRVKIIRHILSITIAANFQSLFIFVLRSSSFNLSVIVCKTNNYSQSVLFNSPFYFYSFLFSYIINQQKTFAKFTPKWL